MSLTHQVVTLYASATTQLNPIANIPNYCEGLTLSIQNISTGNYVYVGDGSTSSANFGFRLSPNQSISLDLDPSDTITVATNDTSTQVALMRVFWQ